MADGPKPPITPCDQGTQRVSGRIHLQVRSKARCDLPGVREHKNFASAKGSKSARFAGVRGWNLNLLRHQRLKRLVAFSLVILHRRPAEARHLSTAAAGDKLAACFQALIDVTVVIDGRRCPVVSQVDRAHARSELIRIKTSRLKVVVGGLSRTCRARRLEEHVEWKKRTG